MPIEARLLEIATIAGAVVSLMIQLIDGSSVIELALLALTALVSVTLVFLATRKRMVIAWFVEAILSALWVTYFGWIVWTALSVLTPIELLIAMGGLGLTNLALSVATLVLLFTAPVRKWVWSSPIEPKRQPR